MKLTLKDKPLAVQIWIILGLVLGISLLIITLIIPVVLKIAFTHETYNRIVESQDYILKQGDLKAINQEMTGDLRIRFKPGSPPPPFFVRHVFINLEGKVYSGSMREVPPDLFEDIKSRAFNQKEPRKLYSMDTSKHKIMYVVRKTELGSQEGFLVSYLWGVYRDNLVKLAFQRLMGVLIFVMVISWIASIFIARYLSRPLQTLQARVREIATRKWDQPVKLDRSDEIGQLGKAIDWMRRQLIEQDEKQQSFLQQVSHELKTPIMVIRSYAQSIKDGIFPKGNMENSLEVIEEETLRLERRVRFLLNLTKYNYLSTRSLETSSFDLAELIAKLAENFSWRRTDLDWKLQLEPVTVTADEEKLTVVLENIFDNQIRYARSEVKVRLKKERDNGFSSILLRVWNDGPQIELKVLERIFDRYEKGSEGDFGLGLAIARMIVEMHGGEIWADNEEEGVAFYIRLPFEGETKTKKIEKGK